MGPFHWGISCFIRSQPILRGQGCGRKKIQGKHECVDLLTSGETSTANQMGEKKIQIRRLSPERPIGTYRCINGTNCIYTKVTFASQKGGWCGRPPAPHACGTVHERIGIQINGPSQTTTGTQYDPCDGCLSITSHHITSTHLRRLCAIMSVRISVASDAPHRHRHRHRQLPPHTPEINWRHVKPFTLAAPCKSSNPSLQPPSSPASLFIAAV